MFARCKFSSPFLRIGLVFGHAKLNLMISFIYPTKHRITNVRETRVTGVVSHVLILLSLYMIPHPIAYIPTAVLNGLFLYMAVTSLDGLQMFERILLLFTEQVLL